MQAMFNALFEPSAFSPHGFCLLWEPGLIWLHAVSDGLIFIAYFSIPLVLLRFVRKRPDVAFGWVFWLFAGFILACGTTHLMAIITLWEPLYWLDGLIKLITAMISVTTAIMLWPLLPKALAMPSPTELRLVNEELSRQIEERDRNAMALREREAQLRQAQKMEAVGRLTGGIAHDFNNMLTVVTGNLELMVLRQKAGKDGLMQLVEQAIAGAQRAATLTHRLLAFARQQPLTPAPLDANRLVQEMSDLVRRTLGESYHLELTQADGLWPTFADANQLESALLNLAVNARDAMPDGGLLGIETGNVALESSYIAENGLEVTAGEYVLIAVTDTGTGMPPDVMAQAFEPFFTTKAPGAGTGLGLSQVFGFVKQTGGHVTIASEVGHGTTVKMYFPRYKGEIGAPVAPQRDAPLMLGTGETVLLVEDDSGVRSFTAEALVQLGYRVLQADSAPPALDILRSSERIDLLLTDVVLPGLDGRRMASAARRIRPDLRVLFVYGYARNAIIQNGALDPDMHLLSKPFRVTQLATAVRRELDAPLASGPE
jgi:signal transduction histidine kinase/ActR/RegA family two-component response regulator